MKNELLLSFDYPPMIKVAGGWWHLFGCACAAGIVGDKTSFSTKLRQDSMALIQAGLSSKIGGGIKALSALTPHLNRFLPCPIANLEAAGSLAYPATHLYCGRLRQK